MSVKIKISYELPEELRKVLEALQPLGATHKVAKRQDGRFKRAYVEIKK